MDTIDGLRFLERLNGLTIIILDEEEDLNEPSQYEIRYVYKAKYLGQS